MLLEIICFWILVSVVVFSFLIMHHISVTDRKTRKLCQDRDDQILEISKRAERAFEKTLQSERVLVAAQFDLNEKMNELRAYVHSEQENFSALAKADMVAARRDELIRATELKVALERIISMTTMSRQPPAAIDALSMEAVTNRIKELEEILTPEFHLI